jgi:hypothetical protein
LALAPSLLAAPPVYDLAVYGATAGGVVTAIAAASEGLKVVLLEPGNHVGGMATGGLSRTDVGKREVIGGYALEFYWRVGRQYDIGRYDRQVAWFYEPHVGARVFREWLSAAGVEVLFGKRLRERNGVVKQDGRIVSATTEDGSVYAARMFADCSYEGDLMAQAGVSYTVGREAVSTYGESLAGMREKTPKHQFLVPISAHDEQGKLLPEIQDVASSAPGSADRKVQAYNFRMILSDDPANQLPFPKPPGYDAHRYELLARLLAATNTESHPLRLSDVTLPVSIPNRKADFNNNGPFSTDFLGASWDYPDGSYRRRAEIWQAHVDYTKGFFWFLAHDPRVPKPLQAEVNRWGLAKDEFTDSDHWPHQLYIREARRMVGDFVMTQKDLQTDLTKPDPIGMGSYNSDSHNVERIVNSQGFVENEGDMQVPVTPYQIPYRVILPKRAEASNLLVPVCFSASHVAYSSLRMEPQYMILGQAAGVAAAMALHANVAVQDIDRAALTEKLRGEGAIMEYRAPAVPESFFQDLLRRDRPQR